MEISSDTIVPMDETSALQMVIQALSDTNILEIIFRYLDVQTLLEISLVNKSWCSVARHMIRSTNKRCIARNDGFDPCWELLMLDKTLASATNHPFTGLAIKVYIRRKDKNEQKKHYCVKKQTEAQIVENFSSILNKLPYEYLEIDWDRKSSCPISSLLKKILRTKREQLLQLKITYLPASIDSLTKTLKLTTTPKWLPNLKVLDLSNSGIKRSLKYELIQAAPQLEKLLGMVDVHDLDFFLKYRKVHVIQHYGFYYDDHKCSDEDDDQEGMLNKILLKFAKSSPKLTKFTFCGYRDEASRESAVFGETPEFLQSNLKPLLDSVLTSLETIDLVMSDLIYVLPEVLNINPLCNLKSLQIREFEFGMELCGATIFQQIEWNDLFPALKTVLLSITEDKDGIPCLSIPAQPKDIPCLTVQEFVITAKGESEVFSNFNFGSLLGVCLTFPNVTNFTFTGTVALENILPFVCIAWPSLVSITLKEFPIVWENVDHVFCGISEERAREYQSLSIESLLEESAVRETPSILLLKKLKTLRIEVSHPNPCSWDRPEDIPRDKIFLTHVTAGLVFAHMPDLSVVIKREVCSSESVTCGYTLDHLRPYVKIMD